jgi:hypothetical protein
MVAQEINKVDSSAYATTFRTLYDRLDTLTEQDQINTAEKALTYVRHHHNHHKEGKGNIIDQIRWFVQDDLDAALMLLIPPYHLSPRDKHTTDAPTADNTMTHVHERELFG